MRVYYRLPYITIPVRAVRLFGIDLESDTAVVAHLREISFYLQIRCDYFIPHSLAPRGHKGELRFESLRVLKLLLLWEVYKNKRVVDALIVQFALQYLHIKGKVTVDVLKFLAHHLNLA